MVRLGVCASCGCEAGARWQFRATSFAEVAVSCGFSAEVAITCVFSAEVAILGLILLISVPKLPPRHAQRTWLPPRHAQRTWLPPRHAQRTWLPPRGLGRPSSGVVGRSDAGWDDVGRRRPPLRTRQVAMMCRHPREVALTCTWPPEVALTCTKQAKPAQIRHLGGETARNCHLERTPPGTRQRTPWNPRADGPPELARGHPRHPGTHPRTPRGTPPPTSPPRRLTKDRSPSL